MTLVLALTFTAGTVGAGVASTAEAPADTSMGLAGGQEGTVFKSLTIEGENRVRISFERPELVIDLDPSQAPGLTWGSSMDVLNRTVPDLTTPLLKTSTALRSPYLIRPWLTAYRTGPVATFTSDLKSVHRWTLLVVDSRGREVVQFQGKKNPPRQIEWDGRKTDGTMAQPGLTYSHVLEAFDKAGNKRRFVGEGFQIEAYRRESDRGPEFLIAGDQWRNAATAAGAASSAYLLETASWINLETGAASPVLITATAATYAEARTLGDQVAAQLQPLLPGGETRVAVSAQAEPGTPPGGILQIQAGRLADESEK
jgi:hypothetical protein